MTPMIHVTPGLPTVQLPFREHLSLWSRVLAVSLCPQQVLLMLTAMVTALGPIAIQSLFREYLSLSTQGHEVAQGFRLHLPLLCAPLCPLTIPMDALNW